MRNSINDLKTYNTVQTESQSSAEYISHIRAYQVNVEQITKFKADLEYYSTQIDQIADGKISPKMIDMSIKLSDSPFSEFDIKKDYNALFESKSFVTKLLQKIAPGWYRNKVDKLLKNYLSSCESNLSNSIERQTDFTDTSSLKNSMNLLMKLKQLSDLKKEEYEYKIKITSSESQAYKIIDKIITIYTEMKSSAEKDFASIRGQYFYENNECSQG